MNLAITSNTPGAFDTGAPGMDLSTLTNDPIIDSSVLIYATATKGPVSSFTSADLTLINCTVSSFTQVSQNLFTFFLNPLIDGPFSCQVAAAKFTWNGVANTISNLLTLTYDSGSTYDLQNAAEISVLPHFRGHVASFTDCNDLLSYLSVPGMELIFSKYSVGATMFANGDNPSNRDLYKFGRVDFGTITFSTANFISVDLLITAVRGGNPPSVGSYKNGDDSYSADMIPRLLAVRNSFYEHTGQTLPYQYAAGSRTATQLSSQGVVYRDDYYLKTTNTSYYVGTQAQGDSALIGFITTVLAAGGWYSNFTHWHWQVGDYPDHYMQRLMAAVSGLDVFFGTVNQVVEYYYNKTAVTAIAGLDNVITVTHTPTYATSPYTKIRTPLWVKLDTTGTVLAGSDIACSNGLKVRKISTNVFYIPLIMDYSGSTSSVSVGITTSPDYVNLNPPVIGRVGNAVTIDQPCKLTICRVHKPINLGSSTTPLTVPQVDNTTVNMTVAGATIPVNMQVRVLNVGSGDYFFGRVISYDSGTGALQLSSGSAFQGSGSYSSWSVDQYFHLTAAEIVERNFTLVTAYTIQATLNTALYDYYVEAINSDFKSAVA